MAGSDWQSDLKCSSSGYPDNEVTQLGLAGFWHSGFVCSGAMVIKVASCWFKAGVVLLRVIGLVMK